MTFGSRLQQAREARGLSMADVAAATRLRQTVLARIEAEDIAALGAEVYAVGYIRAYANVVGCEPAPLIADYRAVRDGAAAQPAPAPVRTLVTADTVPTPVRRAPAKVAVQYRPETVIKARASAFDPAELIPIERERPARRVNWSVVMLAILIIVGGVGVGSFVYRLGEVAVVEQVAQPALPTEEDLQSEVDAVAEAPVGSDVPAEVLDPESALTDETAALPAPVTVVVTAQGGRSWLSATDATGAALFEGTLEDGQSETLLSDERVRIVIGNGGAVALSVNGVSLGTPGEAGEVVRAEFGPGEPLS
ncbi:MAG: DUF4115 domain-containing protein [Actinomycetales bacterium]|nr:DUF4115 domain-containing protein [Actinomycetales bacterium]